MEHIYITPNYYNIVDLIATVDSNTELCLLHYKSFGPTKQYEKTRLTVKIINLYGQSREMDFEFRREMTVDSFIERLEYRTYRGWLHSGYNVYAHCGVTKTLKNDIDFTMWKQLMTWCKLHN